LVPLLRAPLELEDVGLAFCAALGGIGLVSSSAEVGEGFSPLFHVVKEGMRSVPFARLRVFSFCHKGAGRGFSAGASAGPKSTGLSFWRKTVFHMLLDTVESQLLLVLGRESMLRLS
jgi:hypothetical protein